MSSSKSDQRSSSELRAGVWLAQGSGAGLPDARQLLAQVQGQLRAAWPQLRTLMDTPGALEMRAELLAALSRRFFARTVKLILGPQVSPQSVLWRYYFT